MYVLLLRPYFTILVFAIECLAKTLENIEDFKQACHEYIIYASNISVKTIDTKCMWQNGLKISD